MKWTLKVRVNRNANRIKELDDRTLDLRVRLDSLWEAYQMHVNFSNERDNKIAELTKQMAVGQGEPTTQK